MNNNEKSRIEITSKEDFQSFIDKLSATIPKIKELFEKENNLIDQIENDSIWSSHSQKKISEKNELLKKNYEDIDKSLNSYLDLGTCAYEAYGEFMKELSVEMSERGGN